MDLPDLYDLEKSELQLASDTAKSIYTTLRNKGGMTIEDRLVMDLSTIVVEAIHCMDKKKSLNAGCLHRVSRYAFSDSQSPLLKLGYSLTVLLEKVLNDLFIAETTISRLLHRPSLRTAAALNPAFALDDLAKIDEEPVDVKLEEPDELAEVKEEEEPIADVYCPATGASHHPSSKRKATTVQDPTSQTAPPEAAAPKRPTTYRKFTAEVSRECYLCGVKTDRFYSSPLKAELRATFLSRIVSESAAEMARVEALRTNNELVHICVSHVSKTPIIEARWAIPSQASTSKAPPVAMETDTLFDESATEIKVEPEDIKLEEPEAFDECAEVKEEPLVDFYPTAGSSYPIDPMSASYASDGMVERAPPPTRMSTSSRNPAGFSSQTVSTCAPARAYGGTCMQPKDQQFSDGSARKCYHCGMLTTRYLPTPRMGARRAAFLSNIITTSAVAKARLTALSTTNEPAYFCLSHVPNKPVVRKKVSSTQLPIAQMVLKCDLCECPVAPCREAPKNHISYRRFLNSIIEETPDQCKKVNWFRNNPGHPVTICAKHFDIMLKYTDNSAPTFSPALLKNIRAMERRANDAILSPENSQGGSGSIGRRYE